MNSHGLGMYLTSVNEMFPPCLKVLFQKPWDVCGSHCTWNFKSIAFDLLCCSFVAIINSTKLYFANGQTLLLSNLCKENNLDHLQVLLDSTDNNRSSWMMSIIQWRFTVTISVFWNVVPYSLVASYQRFTGICCLRFISWMWRESQVHLKCWFPLITTHCHIPKDRLNTHNSENLMLSKMKCLFQIPNKTFEYSVDAKMPHENRSSPSETKIGLVTSDTYEGRLKWSGGSGYI